MIRHVVTYTVAGEVHQSRTFIDRPKRLTVRGAQRILRARGHWLAIVVKLDTRPDDRS